MTGAEWICIGLVVGAAVVVWFMRRGEPDPAWPTWETCPECLATESSPGNPKGKCAWHGGNDPVIFEGERD